MASKHRLAARARSRKEVSIDGRVGPVKAVEVHAAAQRAVALAAGRPRVRGAAGMLRAVSDV